MKVRFSAQARSDLKGIYDFIAKDSPSHARTTRAKLVLRAENLENFPFSGRVNPKFNDQNLREVFFGNYRIAYQIEKVAIIILTVDHTAKVGKDLPSNGR